MTASGKDDTGEASFHSAGEDQEEEGDFEFIQPQPEIQIAAMVNYDTENGADPENILTKVSHIKQEFDRKNLEFWFFDLETKMEFAGVHSQFLKPQLLMINLPANIKQEIKPQLRVRKDSPGVATAYLTAKNRLMQLFGPKPEHDYDTASKLVLTATPSALAKTPDRPHLHK